MELRSSSIVTQLFYLSQLLTVMNMLSGCGSNDAESEICIQGVGLKQPSNVCSINQVCTDLVPIYEIFNPTLTYIDTASDEPFCGTSERGIMSGRPYYYDGEAHRWIDVDGITRYWCEARPVNTSRGSPRPLLIWVTGSGGNAGSLYDATSLRNKLQSFDLTGDPTRPGFILVSIQPRNLHWPTVGSQDGTRSEIYYRDLHSPSTNVDIAFVDYLIDSLVAEGVVDTNRIYLMGWSNGARFTALYAISRHQQTTPGGNQIAAVANYSGGDPYASFDYTKPECAASNLPKTPIPYFMVSRQCDLVACDEKTDLAVTPGSVAEPWISSLRNEIGAETSWLLIDSLGKQSFSCAVKEHCTSSEALLGHLHWPDGIDDTGGVDHEPTMLQFLADH
jgi:predicted esterase